MQLQAFGNLLAYGHNRIQSGHRILENHCYIIAAHLLQITLAHLQHVFALELNRAALDNSRRIRHKVHNRQGSRSLACASLAYQT